MKGPSFNILLADDDKDDCLLFEEALGEIQLATQLSVVHDGEELMRYLLEQKDQLPTVLFLDLNMPRKNGIACLEEIKRNENLKEIPVIIFSTSISENIANQLYIKGARHYICKPADFPKLKMIVQRALQLISQGKTLQPPKENFFIAN